METNVPGEEPNVEANTEEKAPSEPSQGEEVKETEVQTGAVGEEAKQSQPPDYENCFLSAARKSKTALYGVLQGDAYMIEHSTVMRFQIESADLLLMQIAKEDSEDVKEIKAEAAKQIKEKSRGMKLECGTRFVLRNVEYDMYLVIDTENVMKGEWKLTLSAKIVPEALFLVKGSALVSGLSTHMEYNLPGILLTPDGYSLQANPSENDRFWSITVKGQPTTWTFHKYEDATVSDSYVRYMTPIRLKVKDSNCFLSAEKLEVASGDIPDNPVAMTIDSDNIASYFVLVPADFKGGYVKWNQPFYLRHAVTANFLDCTEERVLGFNDIGTEEFQLSIKTSKATSPYVSFNLPIALWTNLESTEGGKVPLTVTEPSSISQALTIAATFDSTYMTDEICGKVAVSSSTGELFEIQPVAYEDTLPYRGLNIMLTVIAYMRSDFKDIGDEIQIFKSSEKSENFTDSSRDLLISIRENIGHLSNAVKQLHGEMKTTSVTDRVTKQKIMMQANVPMELLRLLKLLSSVMGRRWKKNGLVRDEELMEESDDEGSEYKYIENDIDPSNPEEHQLSSEADQPKPLLIEQLPVPLSVNEPQPSSPNLHPDSISDDFDQQGDLGLIQECRALLNELSEPTYQTFKKTLDFILDCIKSFAPGCKKLLSVEKELFEMFNYGKESVGRILAEVFTYAFPTGIDRDKYLFTITDHFTKLTEENIEEQLIFTRMLNKLIQGDSLEGQAFAKYAFDMYISQLTTDDATFRFLERNGKFYVHFLECDSKEFESCNPALKEREKVTEGDSVYYLLEGLDGKYVEYVENFMYLLSGFKTQGLVDVLRNSFNISSSSLQHMITSLSVPITLRIAAIYVFTSILNTQLYLPSQPTIIDLKSPLVSHQFPSNPTDLAKDGSGDDIKEAIRLTLSLLKPTEALFSHRLPSPDKDLEEKAAFQANLEKVGFITALLAMSQTLIQLKKVEESYLYAILTVAKVGLNLIAPKGKTEGEKTILKYWFSVATKAVLEKVGKDFYAKIAIERLYDQILKNINMVVETAIETQLPKYPAAIKHAYEQFAHSRDSLNTEQILNLILTEIFQPAKNVLLDSTLFSKFIERNIRPEMDKKTPLLSDSRPDIVSFYGLEQCSLSLPSVTLWDVMTGVVVNSLPLGLKFDQQLISGIMRAVKLRKLISEKLSEILIVEEDENVIEMREKCGFGQIYELMEELTDTGIGGLERVISILQENPLVTGSKLLSKFEYRYMLQSYLNLNPMNIQIICYVLDRVNKAEIEYKDDKSVQEMCFAGRCAALRFLTNFISDNSACKQTVLKYLRPSHLTYLIPEVADLIRELFDWDFLSTETTKIVFKSLMMEFRKERLTAYYAFYYLKSILYDRLGNFKPSVQNLIIDILGEEFGELITKMQNENNSWNDEEENKSESSQKEKKEEEVESESSQKEEEVGSEGSQKEPEKSGSEKSETGEKAEDEKLSDDDYRYIDFCLMLLAHCATDNNIVRGHIRTLNLPVYMEDIFTAHKHRYGLLSSILQVTNAGYKDTKLSNFEVEYYENALKLVLDVAEEVMENEEEMLDVILGNYYAMIPRKGMVPLSSQLERITAEQIKPLRQLLFLLEGSEKDVASGVIVSLPEAFSILEKSDADPTPLKQRYISLFPRFHSLLSRVQAKDSNFDLSLCQTRLKAAQMSDDFLASTSISASKLNSFSALLTSKPSFMQPLSELFDVIRKETASSLAVEDSMSSKLKEICMTRNPSQACKCIKKLMGRLSVISFYPTIAKFMKSLNEKLRTEVLKQFIKHDIITNSVVTLINDKRIKSDLVILRFLNSVLENQPAELVVKVKDQLVKQLIDSDLLSTIVRELNDSIKIITESHKKNVAISSYMPLLARFDYKTYGQNSRRTDLLGYLRELIASYLELLQKLCDGCNLHMQNYVRTQGGEDGINVVKLVTEYLCTILSMVEGSLSTSDLRSHAIESLKALIEFSTGPCLDNQTLIGRYVPLYISLNKLFESPTSLYYSWTPDTSKSWSDQQTSLRATGIKMLLVLLEGNPNPNVVQIMDKFLKKDLLLNNITQVYTCYVKKYKTEIMTEDPKVEPILPLVKNAINEACFLVTLLSKNEDQKLSDVLRNDEDKRAFDDFYMSFIGYVEIDKPVDDPASPPDANIREIYFVIPFKCKFLPYETAKSLIVDGNHESHQDLIEGLLKSVQPCREEMEYHEQIARNPKMANLLSQWVNLKIMSLVLVFASNLVLLWASEPDFYLRFHWDEWISFIAVFLFGVCQIVLYTIGTVFYVLDAIPTLLAQKSDEGISMEELSTQPDRDDQQQRFKKILTTVETPADPTNTWLKLLCAVQFDIFYLLISLLALPYPMLYPLLLFQIFVYLPDLRTILQAITQNKMQLVYTGVFGLIVLLCLTIVCFEFYRDKFSIGENGMICDGLLECYLSVVNQGLRAGGGLGDALGAPEKTSTDFWARMVFDFAFFICITVILLQIIFGIILDAFGEMRDQRGALMEDINSVCFVCGKQRSDLELYGKGWTYHFENEHSPYAYLSFLVYLLDKNTADCSGVEKFAKEKLVKIDTTFLPSTSKLLAKRKAK